MPAIPKASTATVVPCLQYRDAPAAIEWLCGIFGFERQLVVPGDNGTIAFAKLSYGNGMLMLSSATADNNWYGKLMTQPEDIGGKQTQTVCLAVDDADLIYRRVEETGVEILQEIADAHYGGRGFTCRDLEGHVWSIGT